MTSVAYSGSRLRDYTAVVTRNGQPLSPARSQAVVNHSPDGFEWGYGGSGPAQLALALLLDALGIGVQHQETATRFYQRFKSEVVEQWPRDGFVISAQDILAWLAETLRNATKGE